MLGVCVARRVPTSVDVYPFVFSILPGGDPRSGTQNLRGDGAMSKETTTFAAAAAQDLRITGPPDPRRQWANDLVTRTLRISLPPREPGQQILRGKFGCKSP